MNHFRNHFLETRLTAWLFFVREKSGSHRYVAMTRDLKARLSKHNRGEVRHTAKHRPWRIDIDIAFRIKDKASVYEACLKSHAAREYAKRHF